MSYDISLKPNGRGPGHSRLATWLQKHPLVTQHKGYYDYINPDTDVHFGIEHYLPAQRQRDVADFHDDGAIATFVINFNRPTPFIYEAVNFLAELCNNTDFLTKDHQATDEWQAFDKAATITSYITSADRVMSGMVKRPDMADTFAGALRVDRETLLAAWHWNFHRENVFQAAQAKGRNIWLPKLEFVSIDARIYSYCLWVDGVATMFPPCDLFGLNRNKYAVSTHPIFRRKRPTLDFVRASDFAPIIDRHFQMDPDVPGAISPVIDGGWDAQQEWLARKPGTNSLCDFVYVDGDYYKNLQVKPFTRLAFDALLDDEFFTQSTT